MKNNCNLFFETIGNKLKLEIILKLKKKDTYVNELSASLNQERSKVSHALRSLLDCGFIFAKKVGKRRIYYINSETIIPLLKLADKHIGKYCYYSCKKCREDKNG